MRQKYLRSKYEQHLFSRQEFGDEILDQFLEKIKFNNMSDSIDFLLRMFVNNIDLFKPIAKDVKIKLKYFIFLSIKFFNLKLKLRNILLLMLENFDETETLPIIEFLVQNRDFPKKC